MALSFIIPSAIDSPLSWAIVAARQLISAESGIPPERAERINKFADFVAEAIEPYFVHPNPVNAPHAVDAVKGCFDRTEWAPLFPAKKDEVLRVMISNLAESAKVRAEHGYLV
jgi:hypothetical protein